MKSLTVFTPTFNRAYCLGRLYESLSRQSSDDFVWLIIDDGSSDGTRALVESWIKEGRVAIEYAYKENGGMHTAHNLAYRLIETEINICIDSDDYMPDSAVMDILACWSTIRHDSGVAGMIGLDQAIGGGVIGTLLPEDGSKSRVGHLYRHQGVRGDKKLIYRSLLTKSYPPYPEFPGEKLVPLSRLYTLIDRDYEVVCFNRVWAIVDYQPDGSSGTITKQYFKSPRGFREARLTEIYYGTGWIHRLKNIIHYGVSSIISGDYLYFIRAPFFIKASFLMPLSLMLYAYFRVKVENSTAAK